jgi:hypothetical protein
MRRKRPPLHRPDEGFRAVVVFVVMRHVSPTMRKAASWCEGVEDMTEP